MAFKLGIGDLLEDFGLPGLIIGVGAIVLAPVVAPVLAKAGKPLAKAVIKTGIVAYETSKNVLTEAQQAFEDIIAESKAELAHGETQKVITVKAETESS
jgi:hypothetical protein